MVFNILRNILSKYYIADEQRFYTLHSRWLLENSRSNSQQNALLRLVAGTHHIHEQLLTDHYWKDKKCRGGRQPFWGLRSSPSNHMHPVISTILKTKHAPTTQAPTFSLLPTPHAQASHTCSSLLAVTTYIPMGSSICVTSHRALQMLWLALMRPWSSGKEALHKINNYTFCKKFCRTLSCSCNLLCWYCNILNIKINLKKK